ncbi:MAG: hypothetical protein QM784_08250 [Polyangiaceae bacterium]
MVQPGQILLLKLLLAPTLVGLVSIAVARLGEKVGGIIAAFPMVSGPVLFLFALEQGPAFTVRAAHHSLFGLVSLVAYCLTYARTAQLIRSSAAPLVCLMVGWATFGLVTFGAERANLPEALGMPVALLAIVVGVRLLPRVETLPPTRPQRKPRAIQYLLPRMLSAAALVYGLSEAATVLGPRFSGLLTPFPVASTVLLVATHRELGVAGMVRWLHGFVTGLGGYVAFVSILAWTLVGGGLAFGFAMGLFAAFAVQTWIGSLRRIESSRETLRTPED